MYPVLKIPLIKLFQDNPCPSLEIDSKIVKKFSPVILKVLRSCIKKGLSLDKLSIILFFSTSASMLVILSESSKPLTLTSPV